MPIVVSNKQRIFYRFEGEKGAFLVLHHGLLGCHRDWYETGFVDALAPEFRLILLDARGHGRSDRPLEPGQYALGTLADDVVSVLDELDIRNAHFLGYSLGALVGFELLCRHPERLRIAMLGGECPFVSEDSRERWQAWAGILREEGLGALARHLREQCLLAALEREYDEESERAPAQALLDMLAAAEPWPGPRLAVNSPVTLFSAEDDPSASRIREARRAIHRARFVSLPNLRHDAVLSERESLLAEVVRLLKSGRRQAGERTGGRSSAETRGRSAHGRPQDDGGSEAATPEAPHASDQPAAASGDPDLRSGEHEATTGQSQGGEGTLTSGPGRPGDGSGEGDGSATGPLRSADARAAAEEREREKQPGEEPPGAALDEDVPTAQGDGPT